MSGRYAADLTSANDRPTRFGKGCRGTFLLICDFPRIFLFLFSSAFFGFFFFFFFCSLSLSCVRLPRVLNHGFRPCRLSSSFHDSIQVPAPPLAFQRRLIGWVDMTAPGVETYNSCT